MDLYSLFEWFESSWLGYIGSNYGSVYALFGQSIHLMALAVLGGSVLVTDLRLLNVILRDVPAETVVENAHKFFKIGLIVIVATGVFMAAAIALRMYGNLFFWSKMVSLLVGVIFVFAIKMPLLRRSNYGADKVWVTRLVAVASLCIWFTVAATGRWIGFSG